MALRPLPVGTELVLADPDPGTGSDTGPAADPVPADRHCSRGIVGIVASQSWNTGAVVAAGELQHHWWSCSTPQSFSGESHFHY